MRSMTATHFLAGGSCSGSPRCSRSVGTGAAAPDRLGQMTEYEAIEVGD
jgi:hypothetical protein